MVDLLLRRFPRLPGQGRYPPICLNSQICFHRSQLIFRKQQKKYNNNFVSKKVEVLVKGKGKKINQYRGTTKWMQVVNFELSKEAKSIENVKIIKASNNSLLGEVL